jgi:lysophospholipase L1-like esterase
MIRGPVRIAFSAAAVAAVTACSGSATSVGSDAKPIPASYYLALGDSLAQGIQPNAMGASVETQQGYPDQVYAALRPRHPGLRLVKLGCPGETTSTMIDGGICHYPGGSQLAAAVAFLRAHRGHVFVVTVDIGANDLEDCGSQQSLIKVISCFVSSVPGAVSRLATIMGRLRTAAGPSVRMAGMNYYLPALAEWRDGSSGQAVARLSERLDADYNELLEHVYADYGARVANVFGAFDTGDFGDQVTLPGLSKVPRNVALLCRWTWECTAPPRGPNQHANTAGYRVIARAFLQAAGLG